MSTEIFMKVCLRSFSVSTKQNVENHIQRILRVKQLLQHAFVPSQPPNSPGARMIGKPLVDV